MISVPKVLRIQHPRSAGVGIGIRVSGGGTDPVEKVRKGGACACDFCSKGKDADCQESGIVRGPCLTGGVMASADRTYDDVKKNPALISVTTAKDKIALYDQWTAYEQVG